MNWTKAQQRGLLIVTTIALLVMLVRVFGS